MLVYACVCMMHVHVYVCMHGACTCVCVYACALIWDWVCMCLFECMHACICVCWGGGSKLMTPGAVNFKLVNFQVKSRRSSGTVSNQCSIMHQHE